MITDDTLLYLPKAPGRSSTVWTPYLLLKLNLQYKWMPSICFQMEYYNRRLIWAILRLNSELKKLSHPSDDQIFGAKISYDKTWLFSKMPKNIVIIKIFVENCNFYLKMTRNVVILIRIHQKSSRFLSKTTTFCTKIGTNFITVSISTNSS